MDRFDPEAFAEVQKTLKDLAASHSDLTASHGALQESLSAFKEKTRSQVAYLARQHGLQAAHELLLEVQEVYAPSGRAPQGGTS